MKTKILIFAIFMVAIISCSQEKKEDVVLIGAVTTENVYREDYKILNQMFSWDTLVLIKTQKGDTVSAAMVKEDFLSAIKRGSFQQVMVIEPSGFRFIK